MLRVENVSVRYGSRWVLSGISFEVPENTWMMVVGPNGAGKSTLIRAIAQTVPSEGEYWLNKTSLRRMSALERARNIGVLPQRSQVIDAYTVDEIVRLGRYAHERGILARQDHDGDDAVRRAMEMTGVLDLRDKQVHKLSGGELQRVFLAQVFAQQPGILLLDEPANHLDIKYQQQVFELIREWLQNGSRAVISVVHDLALARKYADQVLLLNEGSLVSVGSPDHVLTESSLAGVYGMDVSCWMRDLYRRWAE